MARRATAANEPKWRVETLDEQPIDGAGGEGDEDEEGGARDFAARREELEASVARLGEELEWLERDGEGFLSREGRDGASLAALEREWASDLRSLAAATLGWLKGERGAAREWREEAIAQACDPRTRCVTWDGWPEWLDELCDEMGVKQVVLAPSVLRRRQERGRRVVVLVELLEGADEDAEFRAGGLELLRHELGERLGRRVEVHLVSELREWVCPATLLLRVLAYGVCAYHTARDGAAWDDRLVDRGGV